MPERKRALANLICEALKGQSLSYEGMCNKLEALPQAIELTLFRLERRGKVLRLEDRYYLPPRPKLKVKAAIKPAVKRAAKWRFLSGNIF